MRPSIASLFALIVTSGLLLSFAGCAGKEVAVGSTDQQLQRRGDGGPTGDGATCSWSGTTLRVASGCAPIPTPSGYGPYQVGEEFVAPDGCNQCVCTERGILCTVRDCSAASDVACTDDAKQCPDGSAVGRVGPNCEFAPCPGEEKVGCTLEAKLCPDGSAVGRVGPNCEFAPCPGEEPAVDDAQDACRVTCTTDVKECPDGSSVGRVAPDCAFAPCSNDDVACPEDAKLCPDGSAVVRVGPECEFAPCPNEESQMACTMDAKLCPDGSSVGRVPPSCEFAPCPTDGYDPCAGKACGDPCTLCPPDAKDCAETAVLKQCGADGTCSHESAACQ